ncbi:FKBP-type peptidyl-prolyl cis-trans isomerase [Candidatus Stoquefichus massiliensis]|uniref:FKBP-type peptidyl-prolyl cis-trans isomerase n=1 Tax=Candidatus Stoquefichus massiliensis TaxID=1470350 RepID=UPI0004803F00|nr:FKBP-type peptidyl-prolyl cis-trans isomerase [Candidatus Stoquefichus massiliensis]
MKKILTLLLSLGLLFGCSTNQNSSHIKASNGDVVKINYVGKLNGTAFQGGSAEGALLELGSGTFIDGFEEQIVGMQLGSSQTIKVTFPANYGSEDLAGKETTFDIKLLNVYQEITSECQNGDIVKIDFVGKLDGTAFNGGTGNSYLLELGSGTFIDGFEEQLVGMQATKSKTIEVTFPNNYGSSELAGKDVTFDVAVNHIYREAK